MRILFVSAELSPFVRTGGLGDAVAGLAGAIAAKGHDVTVALPAYRELRSLGEPHGAWRHHASGDVEVRLYDDPDAFDRPGVYGPTPGSGYDDNWSRYGRFAAAAASLADSEGFDVVHLQDAHTGPVALLTGLPTVYTIHNASHPVLGPLGESAALLGLGPEATVAGGSLEWYGQANYLKAGLVGSDQVTTVSQGHASELAVDETGFGLAGIIRSLPQPIVGILNGIDTTLWDPGTDTVLPEPFTDRDLTGREASRKELMATGGLSEGVLFGNVGRMARQKGLGLLEGHVDRLVAEGFRLVLVGNGELDDLVDGWAARHPDAVAHLPYSEELARLVSAGVDAYLMPSQFEPCGLGQMYSMRYGAPPVVRYTGGLADSVIDIDEDPDAGTGMVFRTFEPASLVKTIRRAMRYRAGFPQLWEKMQLNGMRTDFSWDARAGEYERVYGAVT